MGGGINFDMDSTRTNIGEFNSSKISCLEEPSEFIFTCKMRIVCFEYTTLPILVEKNAITQNDLDIIPALTKINIPFAKLFNLILW